MANSFLNVPIDVQDPIALKRVLSRIIEELDALRGDNPTVSVTELITRVEALEENEL
jgi:hypothetical protein